MADPVSDEVKLIRAMIRSTEAKFVILSASEKTSLLYNRNTAMITTPSVSVNSDSLQSFNVGENKVKYLFKVE